MLYEVITPYASTSLEPDSDFAGSIYFDGSSSQEFTVEVVNGGTASGGGTAATFRVSVITSYSIHYTKLYDIWRGPDRPTAGCTSMDPAALEALVAWLDAGAAPVLVQLPEVDYQRLREVWRLP